MNTDEEALLGRQDVVFVNKSAGSSCCCCSFLALVLWVVFFMMTTECGTRISPVEHILPENALAATALLATLYVRAHIEDRH